MDPPAPLFGREDELRIIGLLLRQEDGGGGALLIRGEPGIGKSALVADAARRASDAGMLTLSAVGVETEAKLAFAGLHQLLRRVLDRADRLPEPQRAALLGAFGMVEATGSDPFLTALATLHLLGEVATRRPVLLIADDAHWFDRPTQDVLAFVARRLDSDPIAMLAVARVGTEAGLESAGIPELTVRPLDQAAASALLETRGELPPDARERLLREAAGNPLALVELLPQPGRPEEQGRSYHSSHLSRRLERSFVARLEILPPHTQTVLLCAALNDADGLAETLKAASVLAGASLTEDDIRPARSAGLVEYDAWSLRFRHPLMRTAIGQATGIAERRAAHGALATALSSDPGRRLWHQAASLSQPDESVARELQGVAERALTQGDLTGAAAAFDQAARLSTQPDGRSDLLLRAAEIQSQIGRLDEVQRLLRRAETGELRPAGAARKAWLECSVDMYERSGPGPIAPLVEIVERLRLAELTDLAMAGLDQIAASLWTTARDDESRRAVVDAALRMPVSPTDPRLLAILGFAAPIEQGAVILDRLSRVDPALGRDALADFQLGLAALLAGAVVTARPFIDASVAGLRAQGRLGLLTAALSTQAYHGMWSGRWDLSYPPPMKRFAFRPISETSPQRSVVRSPKRASPLIRATESWLRRSRMPSRNYFCRSARGLCSPTYKLPGACLRWARGSTTRHAITSAVSTTTRM